MPDYETRAREYPPVRIYDILVQGFGAHFVAARTPARAKYQAWLRCNEAYPDITFREFCSLARVRLAHPQIGLERVEVLGRPATRLDVFEGSGRACFIYDDSDAVRYAHPSDVRLLVGADASTLP